MPASPAQARCDSAAIPTGGSTDESAVLLSAVLSDPDLNQIRLQVEVRFLGTPFIDSATGSSGYVSNNGTATIPVAGLAAGSYHWQCRTQDINGALSEWVPFGGNLETDADFVIATVASANAADVPSMVDQYRSDGTAALAVGATTSETRVTIKATVTDVDGDPVRLQIERRTTVTAFSAVTHSSSYVASGSQATIEITGLTNGNYYWRYRAEDSHGQASAWTSFGGNLDNTPPVPPADNDFVVNTAANTAPDLAGSPGQFTTADVPIAPGGTTSESTVRFSAAVSDAQGDGVRLQVEVRSLGSPFFGRPSGESALVAGGGTATLDIAGIANGSHRWQYRTVDGSGSASVWTAVGGSPDFVVDVPMPPSGGGHHGGCGVSGGAGSPLALIVIGLAVLLAVRRR